MVCEQRLLKGEGPKTGWSREMTNDGELILVRPTAACEALTPRGYSGGNPSQCIRDLDFPSHPLLCFTKALLRVLRPYVQNWGPWCPRM